MKKRIALHVAAATVLFGTTMFTSCSKDDMAGIDNLTNANSEVVISPVKETQIQAFSKGNLLNASKVIRYAAYQGDAQANINYFKVTDQNMSDDQLSSQRPAYYPYRNNAPKTTDRGEQVSTAEYNFVINYIKEHPNDGGQECDLENYFIQNVGSSFDSYTTTPDQNGSTEIVKGGEKMDYLTIGGIHFLDYNASYGPRALVLGIRADQSPTYKDSYSDNNENVKEDKYKFYKITYNNETNWYLCFDYTTQKHDGKNGTVGKSHAGDGVYNDWVVKLTPADGSTITPNPDPTTDPTSVTVRKGEVEVNLAFNAPKTTDDYISSHLSIHVRDTSDVEVFIPINQKYYCTEDDMYIVKNHDKVDETFKYAHKTQTWKIANIDVVLTVAYEPNGIRITTNGICAAVLQELRKTYHDGITFEVWNYYNSEIDENGQTKSLDRDFYLDLLKKEGSQPTITFTSDNVYQYTNAFGKDKDDWTSEGTPYTKVNELAVEVKLKNTPYTEQNDWEEKIGNNKVEMIFTNDNIYKDLIEKGIQPLPAAAYINAIDEAISK